MSNEKASSQKITLINQATKEPKDFDYDHALNILRYEEKKKFNCWGLPEDSKLNFKNGDFIHRSGTAMPKESKEQSKHS